MNTVALNTIEYINELEAASLDERLAKKAHATALARIIDNNLATKRDIKELETKIAMAKKDTVIN